MGKVCSYLNYNLYPFFTYKEINFNQNNITVYYRIWALKHELINVAVEIIISIICYLSRNTL